MTLAVAVITADGIVLAADSRSTIGLPVPPAPGIAPQPANRVLSDFTHKVFKVDEIAVATYGYAFISNRNIAGHMAEFRRTIPDESTPNMVAVLLCLFFGDRLEKHYQAGLDTPPPAGQNVLGFLVGGYEDGVGVLYEALLPTMMVLRIADSEAGGAAWRGQYDVVARLIKGVDLDLLNQLVASGANQAHANALQNVFSQMEYFIPFGSLNLQDAIDFAVLAIRTTIDVQRLTHGVIGRMGSWPGVGGPIEIAAVLPLEGCRWVQQTQLGGERAAGDAVRI